MYKVYTFLKHRNKNRTVYILHLLAVIQKNNLLYIQGCLIYRIVAFPIQKYSL